jgi:hypothetical protein
VTMASSAVTFVFLLRLQCTCVSVAIVSCHQAVQQLV